MTQTLSGTYTSGIVLTDPDTSVTGTGRVDTSIGIGIEGPAGTVWTLTNAGTVVTGSNFASSVYLRDGGVVGNTGAIEAALGTGVRIGGGSGDISNSGVILAREFGAYLSSGGSVTNTASGTITGNFGVFVLSQAGAVVNDGDILGAGTRGVGIDLEEGGTIANNANGTILGQDGVIAYRGPVFLTNAGLIAGTGTVSGDDGFGVRLRAGGAVTNASTGTITGAVAVQLQNVSTDMFNYGSVAGTEFGVRLTSGGTLWNEGSVTAGLAGTGVQIAGYGEVRNGALGIIGGAKGIEMMDGPAAVWNEGSIVSYGSLAGPAVLMHEPGSTVTNLGAISSNSTFAVVFEGYGSNLLRLGETATMLGGVSASGQGNTIELSGGVDDNGTLSGVGDTVLGFGTIAISSDPGADWAIGGTLFGTTILGFDKTDKLDLVGVDADGVTFDNGLLSVYGGGALLGTILLPGAFAASDFFLRADGSGGTEIVLPDIYSGTYTSGLDLAADTSTITATGRVDAAMHGVSSTDDVRRTLVNEGTVIADQIGVDLEGGGVLDNRGFIQGAAGLIGYGRNTTLVNSGTMLGTISGGAVLLAPGGQVTNTASGTITGAPGLAFLESGTVVNDGVIVGSGTSVASAGVLLVRGGRITNNAGASISGDFGVIAQYTAATVVNDGLIASVGAYGLGIDLMDGGLVENLGSGIVQGSVRADYGALTVVNSGSIVSTAQYVFATALLYGGDVTNAAGGVIRGDGGVVISGGTLVNDGTITGISGPGAVMLDGGQVTNGLGASISGQAAGVIGVDGALYVSNRGEIRSAGFGVELQDGGAVSNSATGLIEGENGVAGSYSTITVVNDGSIGGGGGIGVALGLGGTVTNRGVISGAAGAVRFDGSVAGRLIIEPGAVFVGGVTGSGSGLRTLELASAASVGTITGIGTTFQGFDAIQVDAGAQWVLTGTNSLGPGVTLSGSGTLDVSGVLDTDGAVIGFGGAITGSGTVGIGAGAVVRLGGSVAAAQHVVFGAGNGTLGVGSASGFLATVFGFGAGDTIDFSAVAGGAGVTTGLAAGNQLTLSLAGAVVATIQLDPGQDFTGRYFHAAADGSGGTLVTEDAVPCFLRGTRLAVPGGEQAVEALQPGDLVRTLSGFAPIRFVGRGRMALTDRTRCSLGPVTIRAGALAAGVPRRDLHVTRDHAVLVGDVLVPVEHLVNDATIVWDERDGDVEYFHIELARHDVLLAEGAPLESFRDAGSALLFANAADRAAHDAAPCRDVIEAGAALEHAWRAVARRAGPLPDVRLDADADLHVLAGGRRIDPRTDGEVERFQLAGPCGDVLILSRTLVPAAHGLGTDLRRLGVALSGVAVVQGGVRRAVPLGSLASGFHADEGAARWTNGAAVLPASLFRDCDGPFTLELTLATRRRYPVGVMARALAA